MQHKSETVIRGVDLWCGDCLEILPLLPDNSLDSCVTDPPYHLVSINRRFCDTSLSDDTGTSDRSRRGADAMARLSKGFMGKSWDGGQIAQSVELWRQVYRVLKPGAHLLAFGGTRTYHRMACAIEDAGFEIRDCIQWIYGSGFPKSHDVSKGIDRAAGAEREVMGDKTFANGTKARRTQNLGGNVFADPESRDSNLSITAPATDSARQWQGWGTALKPCVEMIVMARKPLSEKTVAANVLKWGVGAINIDSCRVPSNIGQRPNNRGQVWGQDQSLCDLCAGHAAQSAKNGIQETKVFSATNRAEQILRERGAIPQHATGKTGTGCFDGTTPEPTATNLNTEEFGRTQTAQSGSGTKSTTSTATEQTTGLKTCASCGSPITYRSINGNTKQEQSGLRQMPNAQGSVGRWPGNLIHDGSDEVVGAFPETHSGQWRDGMPQLPTSGYAKGAESARVREGRESDQGSAARFFYTAKADSDDRIASKHPTVKPLDLMQYLVRLVTPKGGTCLDPFAGTGTTGEAAVREGMKAVLIEREADYQADIRRRMALVMSGQDERARQIAKEKTKDKPLDSGPLFGGVA